MSMEENLRRWQEQVGEIGTALSDTPKEYCVHAAHFLNTLDDYDLESYTAAHKKGRGFNPALLTL
jgi:hypothetical protein